MERIVLGIAFFAFAFCDYMLYRNILVYNYRMWVLDESAATLATRLDNHDKLPTYDKMMWQLFRFNWDDYLTEDQ